MNGMGSTNIFQQSIVAGTLQTSVSHHLFVHQSFIDGRPLAIILEIIEETISGAKLHNAYRNSP